MAHKSVFNILNGLKPYMTHANVMKVMTRCQEFSEVPLRYNEDVLNLEYACTVADSLVVAGMFPNRRACLQDFSLEGSLDLASAKARLLLVGHLARVRPPIIDYITDLKSVIEQTGRVLQAFVDIAAESGMMSPVKSCIELSQMLYQGRFLCAQSPLQSLAPDWDKQCDVAVASEGICCVADAVSKRKDLVQILTSQGVKVNVAQAAKRMAERMPFMTVDAELSSNGMAVTVTLKNIGSRYGGTAQTSASNVRRRPAGWFVLLSSPNSDTLLALKRIGHVAPDGSVRSLNIAVPVGKDAEAVEASSPCMVTVMSDSFIGIDVQVHVGVPLLE
jgi:hypothetical protein